MSIKATILAAQDRKQKTVTVPEWGVDVVIRELSSGDREAMASLYFEADKVGAVPENATAFIVARGLYDQGGNRLFTDDEAAELGKKSHAVIDRLCAEINEMSGLNAEAVEEAEGN